MKGKIAIPTRENHVDDHFGHCEYYTIFTIDESNGIKSEEMFAAPKGCGCKSNIASILRQKGVTTLLAGNMGQGAVNKLSESEIRVIRGCHGNITEVVDNYLKGKTIDSGLTCDHHHYEHQQGHQCNH